MTQPQDPWKAKTITSLNQVRDFYAEHVKHFMSDRERISRLVQQQVESATRSVVMSALGFTVRFDRVEIDRPNGQMNPFSQWLVEQILETAKAWFSEEFIEDELKKISAKGRAQLEKVYREEYKAQLWKKVRQAAIARAEEDAERFMAALPELQLPLPNDLPSPEPEADDDEDADDDESDEDFFES